MFTGDSSGETLYAALHRAGFASQPTSAARDDGLTLHGAFITAIGRCAPPDNRPTPEEFANCQPFLARELALLAGVRVVLALGQLAFDGYLRLLREQGHPAPRLKSPMARATLWATAARAAGVVPSEPPKHPTGRLTPDMLDAVLAEAKK
jgi:uracil-DNA glycosylase